jgi:predicted RNase H-like HicB family nuclease
MREVVIYPDEGGQGWVVECPSLPGCVSEGDTVEEAILNIQDAIQGYIESLEADGLPVPPEHFETRIVAVS